QRSASRVSAAIPEFSKIGGNLNIKPRSLSLLLPQLGHEPLHLLVERLVILLGRLSTDVPARSEHMPVLANLVQPSALAEPRHVHILPSASLTPPSVIRVRDPRDVLVGQLAARAVDHPAELAGVDEQDLSATVAELAVLAVAGQEPQARRDLRRVEELARQRHHAVHEVGLDQVLTDLASA